MTDRYDRDIESILSDIDNPIAVYWDDASPLFDYVHPARIMAGHMACGCLTQVKADTAFAMSKNNLDKMIGYDDALDDLIKGDDLIPDDPSDITTDNLWVFAWWQRRLDRYYADELTTEQLAQQLADRKENDR